MNNYCRNCGKKIEDNAKFCDACGVEVIEKRIEPEKKEAELQEFKKKEKKFVIAILSLYASTYLFSGLIYINDSLPNPSETLYKLVAAIIPLLSLAALITLVYARITLKESKAIRIIFIIFLILTGLIVLYYLFILLVCLGLLGALSGW